MPRHSTPTPESGFFPATYQLLTTQLVEDAVVFVKGCLDKRKDVPRLVAMELQVPDLSNADGDGPVRLDMNESQVTARSVQQLKKIFQAHSGPTEVHLRVRGPVKATVYRLGYRVTVRPEFWADLKATVAVTQAT